jgi:hypothetical protein
MSQKIRRDVQRKSREKLELSVENTGIGEQKERNHR